MNHTFFLGGPVPPVCHAIFLFLDVLCMFFIPRFSNGWRKPSPILMTLLDALRMAYLMQCYFSKERGGSASAYDMLKIATVGGAKMLGRQELGSLENGKGADLFMIDAETLELTGTEHDPRSVLARAGVTGHVYLTMINGKVVYRDGQLQGVDERRLRAEGEEVCTRVLREPHAAFHNLF